MNTVAHEVLEISSGQSFLIRKFDKMAFNAPFHSHPEYELTYILKGSGRRYVGSHVGEFEEGDLVLLEANLPHCWKLAPDRVEQEAQAVVLQFTPDFLGEEFLAKPELYAIQNLLQHSCSGGLQFAHNTVAIGRLLIRLYKEESPFNRLLLVLEILQKLAKTTGFKRLNQYDSLALKVSGKRERIEKVYAYIIENFRRNISLDEAANLVSMTPQSFCKYFKKVTRNTFLEMVIKYRLDYAMQQLSQTHKSVTTVCYESGFKDLSYFCKKFKAQTDYTPSDYRKAFQVL